MTMNIMNMTTVAVVPASLKASLHFFIIRTHPAVLG